MSINELGYIGCSSCELEENLGLRKVMVQDVLLSCLLPHKFSRQITDVDS